MVDPAFPALPEWGNFYVIIGSAGGALTGLMFVVIALRRVEIARAGERAVRAFGTPTVLHFCGVLLIAALMCIPRHTVATLAMSVGATGVAGLALSAWVAFQARGQSFYEPVLSDWVWHVAMPVLAYGTVAAAAGVLFSRPTVGLDMICAGSLLLLFIGIRNAWDSAVWIAAKNL